MLETMKYLMGWAGESGFGSKTTAEEVSKECGHLGSKTAIITGATSGIGEETARVLAMRGARVVIAARSSKAAEETKGRILEECPQAELIFIPLDLSSLSSVTNFVRHFNSLHLPLHLLLNNAAVFSSHHALSHDGFEMTFATNYLGHFLLTKLLIKNMVQTAELTGIQGRIVNVSSNYHNNFNGDIISYLNLIAKHKSQYNAARAYALSKLANVLHTKELAHRLKQMKANVTVNCVHPGVVRTKLLAGKEGIVKFIIDLAFFLVSKFVKTIPQAAATTCYVATHPSLEKVSGKYFLDCNEASPSKLGSNSYEAQRLWIASEIMICNGTLENNESV